LTLQQERLDAQDLGVLRLAGQAGFHATPGIVQPVLAFIPNGQAQLRVDGKRRGGDGLLIARARPVQPAEPLRLLAKQHQQ